LGYWLILLCFGGQIILALAIESIIIWLPGLLDTLIRCLKNSLLNCTLGCSMSRITHIVKEFCFFDGTEIRISMLDVLVATLLFLLGSLRCRMYL
jgi:hypothetical protein